MGMIEVKTAELTGPALDWAVAMAEGWEADRPCDGQIKSEYRHLLVGKCPVWGNPHNYYSPSTEWAHGGPLRDKYRVSVDELAFGQEVSAKCWGDGDGHQVMGLSSAVGDTALVAICRAIVAAKLGDVVQVPAELVGVAA